MKYPSVTEILGKYQDFSMIPPERLALACDRGKAVHAYCAAYAAGIWIPRPKGSEGYCESYVTWFNEYVEEVFLIEEELVDKTFGFVGHPDLIARLKGDKAATVVDLKTPVALLRIWAVQLASYLHLAKTKLPLPLTKAFVSGCGSLRLDPRGKPAKFKHYTDSAQDFQAFLNALTAHKFFIK